MKTILIIARHGNTFNPSQIPTRVGARTDIPLVESVRGKSIGTYLKNNHLIPSHVFSSPLLRTMQTAQLAVQVMGVNLPIIPENNFKEIDYGPDENKTEDEVMIRLGNGDIERGRNIIEKWNREAVVPEGWKANPELIKQNWFDFSDRIRHQFSGEVILLVTSNGILRFAPYITGDFKTFSKLHDLKVSTGGICIFEIGQSDLNWNCTGWNIKPYK